MSGGPVETGEGIPSSTAYQLQVISAAMAGGLTLMAGLACWSYASAAARVPSPNDVKTINVFTIVEMASALAAVIASEIAWRSLLRGDGPLSGRVQSAFIIRLACREGAGLLGVVVIYLAALNGVLRAYPAYWVNLAPYGLFLAFLAAHWPSVEKLTEEAGGNPSFLKK